MTFSFAIATLLMGVVGGPHCIAMCGAACTAMQQQRAHFSAFTFQAGRILGYSILGALAATTVKGLAWFSSQTYALHPLWTFFHTLVFAWGVLLVLFARQPVWADRAGQAIWLALKKASYSNRSGYFFTGVLWAFMPCGLLYSALLIASLQASPLNGALSMAAFAFGSGFSLYLGPVLWLKLKRGVSWASDTVSIRLAGIFLVIVSGVAIWMDVIHQTKIWCVS